MWINTYNNISLRYIKKEWTGKLIQIQKGFYDLDNLIPVIREIRMDDAYALFPNKRLLILNSVKEETTADSIVDIYCISRNEKDYASMDLWWRSIIEANNGINLCQVDFLKKAYVSRLLGTNAERDNPLAKLNDLNCYTISEIKSLYIGRCILDKVGGDVVPIIRDILLAEAKSIFEGLWLVVRTKEKQKPNDLTKVDVFELGTGKMVPTYSTFVFNKTRNNEHFYVISADKIDANSKTSTKSKKSAKASLREQLK